MNLREAAEAAPRPFIKQDRPAGEAGAPAEAPTLGDAARRCMQLAREIGAADFGLYSVTPPTERAALVPFFDSGCTAAMTVTGGRGHPVVAYASGSTAPCWWGGASASTRAFERLFWATRVPPLTTGAAGIAFPVHAQRGECGLVVFLGDGMAVSPESLLDLHSRCFALFEDVCRLRRGAGARPPAISRRELECLKLAANGYTAEEIARLLKLSVHTTNQYLNGATQKLDAVNRMHAVAKALRMGLIA